MKPKSNEEEQGIEKANRTDTATLFDIEAGYRGDYPKIHPVMGEAITYDPELAPLTYKSEDSKFSGAVADIFM